MKTVWKIVKIVLIIAFILGLLFLGFFFYVGAHGVNGDHSTADPGEYEAYLDFVPSSGEFMPSLQNCGAYEKAGLSQREHVQMFLDYQSVCLFLQYSDEEYARQKDRIEKAYCFYTEPEGAFLDVSGSFRGYEFRIVRTDDRYTDLKRGKIIAFNDERKTILYACYDHNELDRIDNLEKEMKKILFIPNDWRS